jgi:hypothetical protein
MGREALGTKKPKVGRKHKPDEKEKQSDGSCPDTDSQEDNNNESQNQVKILLNDMKIFLSAKKLVYLDP